MNDTENWWRRRRRRKEMVAVLTAFVELNESAEDVGRLIYERAYSIAYGLKCAAHKRPLTIEEIDLFVDGGCQDLCREIVSNGAARNWPADVIDRSVAFAEAEFRKHFRPLLLNMVPIVEAKDSIAYMEAWGTA